MATQLVLINYQFTDFVTQGYFLSFIWCILLYSKITDFPERKCCSYLPSPFLFFSIDIVWNLLCFIESYHCVELEHCLFSKTSRNTESGNNCKLFWVGRRDSSKLIPKSSHVEDSLISAREDSWLSLHERDRRPWCMHKLENKGDKMTCTKQNIHVKEKRLFKKGTNYN